MKKRYLFLAILLMFSGICHIKAYMLGDCDVIIEYKLSSSQDEDSYICKNNDYSVKDNMISYKRNDKTIYLANANIYSMQIFSDDIKFQISGKNVVSILLLNGKVQVGGKGYLKFKEGSFVKKLENGKPIYTFVYNDSIIIEENNKPFIGTLENFENSYSILQKANDLPEKFSLKDFTLIQKLDYSKMTSIPINQSWIEKHIITDLVTKIVDGYADIHYEDKSSNYQLESENIILLSDKHVDSKYALVVNDLEDGELKNHIKNSLEGKDLLSLYNVSVYNGKKEINMKDGKYTIKVKMQDEFRDYADYQAVYINNEGEIEEYIDAFVDNEYIVFSTSHLSHYGIVAKNQNTTFVANNALQPNKRNWGTIILFLSIVCILFTCICFIAMKVKLFSKKKRKK